MNNTTPKKRSANLSKSRYTLSCQCLKALWLRVYKPEEAVVDPATEARFEMGNVVGDLAMGLFGDFVEVTTKREDGSLDIASMIEKTKACLDPPLFSFITCKSQQLFVTLHSNNY